MLSYTTLQARYKKYTNNANASNVSDGVLYMNDNVKDVLGERDWPFLETSDTSLTIGSQQFYTMPADLDKLINVTVLIGTVLWRPKEVTSREMWDKVNYAGNVTSNIPQYFYVYNGQVGFWPKPSTSGNTITYNYKKRVVDLNLSDYATGAIFTATAGTTTIVGSATNWNQSMAGSYLQIAAAQQNNAGDNFWYKISATATISATQIILASPYKGTAITSGTAAYIIGQMPVLPENYHIMPVYWASANYWRLNGGNMEKAQEYERLYREKLKTFEKDFGQKSTNPKLDGGIWEEPVISPNLTITL